MIMVLSQMSCTVGFWDCAINLFIQTKIILFNNIIIIIQKNVVFFCIFFSEAENFSLQMYPKISHIKSQIVS